MEWILPVEHLAESDIYQLGRNFTSPRSSRSAVRTAYTSACMLRRRGEQLTNELDFSLGYWR